MRAVEVSDVLTVAAMAAANPTWKVKFTHVTKRDRGCVWTESRYFCGGCVMNKYTAERIEKNEGYFMIGPRIGHGASRYCLQCGKKQ